MPIPNPTLNGALNNFAVSHLENAGHHVQVSDLYAMNWKSQLDANDTLATGRRPFPPSMDSKQAFEQGLQCGYCRRAGEITLGGRGHFPVSALVVFDACHWGGSTGFTPGFAYGVGEHSDTHWGDRWRGKPVR
jgi:NAD(P)H dehydrogenase (quinone)